MLPDHHYFVNLDKKYEIFNAQVITIQDGIYKSKYIKKRTKIYFCPL